MNIELLTSLLQQAQAAHHIYEENVSLRTNSPGWTENAWARWYASFIVEQLNRAEARENDVLFDAEEPFPGMGCSHG